MPAQFTWLFLSFKGRISRQEFWLGYFFTLAIMLLLIPPLKDISLALLRPTGRAWYRNELEMGLLMGALMASAIVMWPLLALYVKRLHDFDLSGWWLVGFFATAVVLEMAGLGVKNVSLVLVTVIGMAPGKRGDNRFGPDPIVTKS